MRPHRLIIVATLAILTGCKAIQTTFPIVQEKYTEDLSVHRPDLGVVSVSTIIQNEPTVVPAGHIKMELDSISNLIAAENAKPRIEQGYTIQLYNGSNREEATNSLGRIRIKFPDITSRMEYYQPDFRVKAGLFLDRVVAYETYEKVRRMFPGALLIPEKIKKNFD